MFNRPMTERSLLQRLLAADFGDLFAGVGLVAAVRDDLGRRPADVLTLQVEAACRGLILAELRDKREAGARLVDAYRELIAAEPEAQAA